jgi:large subunit ribosomal protein L17
MVTSLLEHERIQTTDAKAKEVRRVAERMITLGKRGTLHARRRAMRVIRSREVAAKVFDDLAERYRDRAGGYTRVLKLRRRPGDAAPISIIELVEGAPAAGAEAGGGRKPAARRRATGKAPAGKPPAEKPPAGKAPAKPAAARKKPAAKRAEKPKQAAAKPAARKTPTRKKTSPRKKT